MNDPKLLKIVGTGPGDTDNMTLRAFQAIKEADIIVGYTFYNDLLKKDFPDKEYYATPMRQEADRCRYAIEQAAAGRKTVLVCSGDSGVYGMASLVMELLEEYKHETGFMDEKAERPGASSASLPGIEVIPGITAALSGAALIGSPLTNDFAVISLSDLLTPWELIEKRLKAAAQGDLALVLYNPGSKKRTQHLKRACDILLSCRRSDTPCGIAHSIGRTGQYTELLRLGELRNYQADMMMTVFVGNSATRIIDGQLVTPRGYVENGRTCPARSQADYRNGKEFGPDENLLSDDNKNLVVFGGTTEGRILSEGLAARGYKVTLCVATEYGEEVLKLPEALDVRRGRLDEEEINSLISECQPAVVFDATHPYAEGITFTLSHAAASAGVRYIRVRRKIDEIPQGAGDQSFSENAVEGPLVRLMEGCMLTFVPDLETAGSMLDACDDKAFISTGSRGASIFGRVHDAADRLTMRILPSEEAISLCRQAGFAGKNLICMQGPFSQEMNEAMFRAAGSRILVTKSSGKAGGFPEKIAAAEKLGMRVIVIAPPEDIPGMSLDQALDF